MRAFAELFFNNYVFIHTHIEKCGGSSLLRHLTILMGSDHVLDLRSLPPLPADTILKQNPTTKKNLPQVRLLSGHFWYNSGWEKAFIRSKKINSFFSLQSLINSRKNPLYIASVRHPTDRMISFFRYLQADPNHIEYNDHVRNNNFDAFILSLTEKNHPKVKNGMCRQLTNDGKPFNLFNKAKKACDDNYLAVVPYNKTHELANIIANFLELPPVSNQIVNPSINVEKIIPSERTLALLEENCNDDIQLYEYILETYPSKLMKAKAHLEAIFKKYI